jgi:potassium efflux system protein
MGNEQDFGQLGIGYLTGLFVKIQIYLLRTEVQLQVAVVLGLIIVTAIIARAIANRVRWRLKFITEPEEGEKLPFVIAILKRLQPGLHLVFFPAVGLPLTALSILLLDSLGRMTGILVMLASILWILLAYRLLLGALYFSFPYNDVRRFHLRLLGPLFALFVVLRILAQLSNLSDLGRVVLLNLSESPITVGALFLATIGLYFWVDSVWGSSYIISRVLPRYFPINPGILEAALTLGGYILVGLGFVLALSVLGLNTTTIAAITGGLSVGIGFGLREILGNFVSGILLLFEQSIRPGDVLEVDDTMVVVDRLGIRSTQVHTLDNVEIIVPNESILTSSVKTYTKTHKIIRHLITVGVSYDSDPNEVTEALLIVAGQEPDVLEEPAPVVFFEEFGASSLDFQLGVWLDPVQVKPISSRLRYRIWDEFARRNIEIPFPQRDLHIRSGLPGVE